MPGSATALGRAGTRNNALTHVAFRQRYGVGTQDDVDFAAQWLAYAIPCRRFADVLADTCARLGADVVCYTFTVADSHHLLLAGLPAHAACDPIHLFALQVERLSCSAPTYGRDNRWNGAWMGDYVNVVEAGMIVTATSAQMALTE